MKIYLLMIRHQLRLSIRKLSVKKENGKIDLKRVGFFALIAFTALSFITMAVFVEYTFMEALKQIDRPALMLVAAALIVMLFALIYGVFYIISILYYSRDTSFLSSLPIPERAIFTGRLASVLLGECSFSLVVMGPAIVIYGIYIHAGVGYYLLGALTVLFLPFFPIALAALTAALLTKFSSLWKRKDLWMIISVLIVLPVALYIQAGSYRLRIQDEGNLGFLLQLIINQQKLLETIAAFFPPAYWAVSGLSSGGFSWLWLLFIVLSITTVTFIVFLLGHRYTRLAVLYEEISSDIGKRKLRKKEQYKVRSPLFALYLREWKEILKTPSYALNCLSGAIVIPIMLTLMMVTLPNNIRAVEFGGILSGMVNELLNEIPASLMILAACALFGFVAIINPAIATAVSREGKHRYIYRIIPVAPGTVVLSKFLMGYSLCIMGTLLMLIIMISLLPQFTVVILLGYFLAMGLAFITCAISLSIDIIHPKYDWRTETEVIKRSVNVLFSLLFSMLLLVAAGFMVYGLNQWISSIDIAACIFAAVIVLLALLSGKLLAFLGNRYYALPE